MKDGAHTIKYSVVEGVVMGAVAAEGAGKEKAEELL